MNDFVNDQTHPEIPENGKRKPNVVYIEDTVGLWVRKNYTDDVIEIWIDGEFLAAWQGADKTNVRLRTMIREGYEEGLRQGKLEAQKQLREALGLEDKS